MTWRRGVLPAERQNGLAAGGVKLTLDDDVGFLRIACSVITLEDVVMQCHVTGQCSNVGRRRHAVSCDGAV